MIKTTILLMLLCLVGCADINVKGIKATQEKNMKNTGKQVQTGTGVELGTEQPKGGKKPKFRMPTAPTDY